MSWYLSFLAVLLFLWGCATEKDRRTLTVMASYSLLSQLSVWLFTQHFTGTWKLIVPASFEVLAIVALYRYAWGRTALIQAVCLLVAWCCHALCYGDLILGTDLIYSNYETALGVVSLAQLIAFHDTIFSLLAKAWRFVCLGVGGGRDIRGGGMPVSVLHHSRTPRI